MSRINCHSAFKHYEMFHSRGGDVINIGSNNTTIFNMGAGFGGGSFWSGLGYGLGNGLGSIFGGLFGGNMGGFGNFGFGMSPWAGMGMFYISMGAGGYGGSNRVDSHSDGKGKVKDDSISNKNIDYAKLNKLFERKNNLLEAKEPKLTDLEKLKNDIDKLAKDLDGNDDGNDNDYIKQLKRGLDDKINELKGKEPATKPAATPETKVDGTGKKDDVTPTEQTSGTTPGSATGKIDTANLTADQIKALTPEQISKLTPDEAKMLLGKLGALNENGDGVNATTNYTKLLLAQQSGLPLSCGHNKSLTNIQGADAYLKGKISNVTLSGDDITFEIETDNMKLKMKCKADSSSYQIDKTIEQKTQIYKDAKSGITYEIVKDKEYGIREGAPAANRK